MNFNKICIILYKEQHINKNGTRELAKETVPGNQSIPLIVVHKKLAFDHIVHLKKDMMSKPANGDT